MAPDNPVAQALSILQRPIRWYRDGGPDDPYSADVRRKQIRLIFYACVVLLAIGVGLGVYQYFATLESRSERAYEEGEKLLRPDSYQRAIDKFDRAISLNGQNEKARLARAEALASLGNRDEALKEYSRIVDLKPDWARGYAGRGKLYRDSGDLAKALVDLDESVKLEPTPENLLERGQVLAALGEWNKAILDYTAYIKLRQGVPYPYTLRAIARAKVGDRAGAEEDRRQALVYEGKLPVLLDAAAMEHKSGPPKGSASGTPRK